MYTYIVTMYFAFTGKALYLNFFLHTLLSVPVNNQCLSVNLGKCVTVFFIF